MGRLRQSRPDKKCNEGVDIALPAAARLILVLEVHHRRILNIQRRWLCDQALSWLRYLLWCGRRRRCRGAARWLQGKLRAHQIVERHIADGRDLCRALSFTESSEMSNVHHW